jgi:hypothetical protein
MLFNRVLLELVMKFLREWVQGLYSFKMAFKKMQSKEDDTKLVEITKCNKWLIDHQHEFW